MWDNRYPYTDFSQLNLDFILRETRRLAEQYDSLDQIVQAIKAEVDDIDANIDDAVRDYFNSMTQADIEQLIASALGQSSRITFVSSGDDTDNSTRLGLCAFIATGNHAVLIDTGNDSDATQLLAALTAAGVDTIDAVIITHWHADHIQGLSGLTDPGQTSISLADSVLYCPHGQIDTSQVTGYSEVGSGWASYMSLDASWKATWTSDYGGYVEPEEYDEAVINGVTYMFNNLDPAKFADYYDYCRGQTGVESSPRISNYNNFSMIVTARYADTACVFMADLELPGTKNNAAIAAWADLFQIEHHGLNYQTDPGYLTSIHAKYSVACCYGTGFSNGFIRMRPTIARCHEVGTVFGTAAANVSFLFSPTGILAFPVNPVTDITGNGSVLEVGQQLLAGDDLDLLTAPGTYTVQNSTVSAAIVNGPNINAGYKLYVVQAANNGYVQQIAFSSNEYNLIAARVILNDGTVVNSWAYLKATSKLAAKHISTYQISADFTVSSNNQNRVEVINGFMNVSFDITATADIAANTTLFQFDGYRAYSTPFVIVSAAGKAIPCRLYGTSGKTIVQNLAQIPDGTHAYGSVCAAIWNGDAT